MISNALGQRSRSSQLQIQRTSKQINSPINFDQKKVLGTLFMVNTCVQRFPRLLKCPASSQIKICIQELVRIEVRSPAAGRNGAPVKNNAPRSAPPTCDSNTVGAICFLLFTEIVRAFLTWSGGASARCSLFLFPDFGRKKCKFLLVNSTSLRRRITPWEVSYSSACVSDEGPVGDARHLQKLEVTKTVAKQTSVRHTSWLGTKRVFLT